MSDEGSPTLPAGWAWAALGEATESTVEQGAPHGEGEFVYLDISGIDNRVKRIAETKRIAVPDAPSRARQHVGPGDVLVSMTRPNLNAVALVPSSMRGAIASTGFHVLRANSSCTPGWLLYLVQTGAFIDAMTRLVQGVLYPAVRPKDIRSYGILLPPLPEQQRIVQEIEKQITRLDAAVAALERARANLKRYRASVLRAACEGHLVPTEAELARAEGREYEPADQLLERILRERRARWEADQLARVQAKGKTSQDDRWKAKYQEPAAPEIDGAPQIAEGWAWATSDTLFSFVTSGSRGWARYYSTEGPLFLRMGNLDHDSISLDLANVQRVKPPLRAEGRRTRVSAGDILISITADTGMVALVPASLEEAYINQHIALARPVDGAQARYVAWFLASDRGQQQLRKLQRGATKVGLGLDDIRSVLIPIPPVSEQRRIVSELERRLSVMDELDTTVEHSLKRADRLRQSILKCAFEGKLVPQDPSDEPASVLLDRIRAVRSSAAQAQDSRRQGRGQRGRSMRHGAATSQPPFER